MSELGNNESIEWGPEIAINGVKPKWLGYYETVMMYDGRSGCWHGEKGLMFAINIGPRDTAIRLPADHWAYPVIAAGMEPWAGGEEAPEDLDDTKDVMFRNGWALRPLPWFGWGHKGSPEDIIGYHKKAELSPAVDLSAVTINPMTEEQARKLWVFSADVTEERFIERLRYVGLIREKNPDDDTRINVKIENCHVINNEHNIESWLTVAGNSATISNCTIIENKLLPDKFDLRTHGVVERMMHREGRMSHLNYFLSCLIQINFKSMKRVSLSRRVSLNINYTISII